MTKATHTPAPWAFVIPDGMVVRHPQVYSDTGPICNATWLGDGKLGELTANARLIAAAPDLLAALTEAEAAVNRSVSGLQTYAVPDWVRLLAAMQSAVAKATGSTP